MVADDKFRNSHFHWPPSESIGPHYSQYSHYSHAWFPMAAIPLFHGRIILFDSKGWLKNPGRIDRLVPDSRSMGFLEILDQPGPGFFPFLPGF